MFILTCSTILLFYLSICDAGSPCPKDTFKKCNCSQNDSPTVFFSENIVLNYTSSTEGLILGELANKFSPTTLSCGGIGATYSDLEIDLSQFRFKVIDKLIIQGVSPATKKEKTLKFSSSMFQDIKIRSIEILNTALSPGFISTGIPFENQLTLTNLSAKDCNLQGPLTYDSCGTVLTKNLEKAPNVKLLDLSNNLITCVSSTAFSNPPTSLSIIDLSNNDISYIFPGAFKKVSSLRSINLASNCIQFQPKDIFPNPAPNLETINLGSNSIKSLPENFFSNMPELKIVNLEDNYLHSMPEKTWSGIWSQLTGLDISGHIMECDCNLLWMVNAKFKADRKVNGTCVNYDEGAENKLQTLTRVQLACSS